MVKIFSHDILVRACSYIGELQDLANAMLVCKSFHKAIHDELIWREYAIRKYSPNVYQQTNHLYDSSYEMVRDDNQRGACPIVYNPGRCLFRHNRVDYWFCCLIRSVYWHRASRSIRVFYDARGERDLRDPIPSGIWRFDPDRFDPERRNLHQARAILARESVRFVDRTGHYQGLLIYPEEAFSQPGTYGFVYANGGVIENIVRGVIVHGRLDYTVAPVLRVEQTLKDAFSDYCLEVSHAAPPNDTEESEREMWAAHVPTEVLQRTNPLWWA